MNFKVHIRGTMVKIYVGDILHLNFNRQKLLGLYSWAEDRYSIELYLTDQIMLVEYDNSDKWIEMLKILDTLI